MQGCDRTTMRTGATILKSILLLLTHVRVLFLSLRSVCQYNECNTCATSVCSLSCLQSLCSSSAVTLQLFSSHSPVVWQPFCSYSAVICHSICSNSAINDSFCSHDKQSLTQRLNNWPHMLVQESWSLRRTRLNPNCLRRVL